MIKANWFTWANAGKILVIVLVGYLLISNFTREEVPDMTEYKQRFNEIQSRIDLVEAEIVEIDAAFDSMFIQLDSTYEKIDSATVDNLRDIINGLVSR